MSQVILNSFFPSNTLREPISELILFKDDNGYYYLATRQIDTQTFYSDLRFHVQKKFKTKREAVKSYNRMARGAP